MRDEDLGRAVHAWPDLVTRAFVSLSTRAPRDGHFHDLRNAFDQRRDDLYIDYTHVVPQGNRIMVDRMLPWVRPPTIKTAAPPRTRTSAGRRARSTPSPGGR